MILQENLNIVHLQRISRADYETKARNDFFFVNCQISLKLRRLFRSKIFTKQIKRSENPTTNKNPRARKNTQILPNKWKWKFIFEFTIGTKCAEEETRRQLSRTERNIRIAAAPRYWLPETVVRCNTEKQKENSSWKLYLTRKRLYGGTESVRTGTRNGNE